MDDLPRKILAELVARFGREFWENPKRCEALLRDFCPQHKRELFVLVSAAKESMPAELFGSASGIPKEVLLSRLAKRLHDDLGIDEDFARWAVESWALALGVVIAKESRIPFKCQECGAAGTAASRLAGQELQCPKCKATIRVSGDVRESSREIAAGASSGRNGIEQDIARSQEVMRLSRAVVSGDAGMQYILGTHYYLGQGVSQNYAEAAEWFQKAAEAGDCRAQLYLSCCYSNGWGVPVDREKAEEWYHKVVEQTEDFLDGPTDYIAPPDMPKCITNSIGMKLILVPAGEFMMGSADFRLLGIPALDDQMPQHRVFISKPFYLGVYPVTQAEYHRVTGTNPSYFNGESHGGFREVWKMLRASGPAQGPFKGQPSHPVESIAWDMANAFCRQLSSLPQEASTGNVYRLPTEAEWEYACRAGTTRRFFFGDDDGSDDDENDQPDSDAPEDFFHNYVWFIFLADDLAGKFARLSRLNRRRVSGQTR